MLLHGALEELLHCLARDRHKIHQVPIRAGCAVLSDASIDIFGDPDLEAVAKESEHVQVLLLCTKSLQLLLESVSPC